MNIFYQMLDITLYLGVLYGLFRLLGGAWRRLKQEDKVCLECGHHGPCALQQEGSGRVTAALSLLLLPGLLYSMWRYSTRQQVCSACGHHRLVPLDSPAARARISDTRSRPLGAAPLHTAPTPLAG